MLRADPLADSRLDNLREALRQEIETREKGHHISAGPSTAEDAFIPTADTLLAGAKPARSRQNQSRSRGPRPCVYCDGNHRPDKCDKVKTSEERQSILKKKRRCFNCLGQNHMKFECYSKGRCMKCKDKHHTSICEETEEARTRSPTATKQQSEKKFPDKDSKDATHMGAAIVNQSHAVLILMPSALVNLKGKLRNCTGRILFDTGAHRSFITKELKDKLHLKPLHTELLNITTFGSRDSNRKSLEVVQLSLQAKQEVIKIFALVTPIICPPLLSKGQGKAIPPELAELKFADPCNTRDDLKVDILIGNDHYGQLVTGNMKKSNDETVIATESKFGWLLSGPVPHQENALCQTIEIRSLEEDKLNETLTKFWEVNEIPQNTPENKVLESFENTITFNKTTGKYNVQLPWNDLKQDLPSNFELSKKRLNSLRYSLKANQELMIKYNKQLHEQLTLGFIEKVENIHNNAGTLHYIPHFPVLKSDGSTQTRIVYDASAKTSEKSLCLNDCLYTGPNLMRDLSAILLKFRTHMYAFTADIEKAFLQIELNEKDRDATRFLWLKDINKPADHSNLEVFRFCRVLFGAAPSPFLLHATIQHHMKQKNTWVSEDIQACMYMDNLVTGTDDEAKVMTYYDKSRSYFKETGMNLRQWTSNSAQLNKKVLEDKTGTGGIVKVLGLMWNPDNDTLSLSIDKLIKEVENIQNITKRSALSIASKLFDPLGFIEPITVRAKTMFQELWKSKIKWDKSLHEEQKTKWLMWFRELCHLKTLSIQRPYLTESGKSQLHIFCDSSKLAYGAVAYLRTGSGNEIKTAFVIAKTKVAPVKTETLPRLELSAALLGANILKYLQEIPGFLDNDLHDHTVERFTNSIVMVNNQETPSTVYPQSSHENKGHNIKSYMEILSNFRKSCRLVDTRSNYTAV